MANDRWGYDPDNPLRYGGLDPNSADPGGGGYSGGTGVQIDPKTGKIDPSYHPPSNGAGGPGGAPTGSGGSGSAPATAAPPTVPPPAWTALGMTAPQWLQSALALYGAYKSSQPGKFQQIPEDASQTAARQKLLGFVDNSPTRDILGNLIGQRLGAARPFELPKSPTGYNPFPSGAAPSYDLSAILPMLMHGGGSTAPPPSAASPSSSDSIGQWLSAHPEILSMGVNVAAGAVAAQFGIPQAQALQIVTAHLQSQRQPQGAPFAGVSP